jgi:putative ubiquitin-RnfH superfamily antitoxin RatB of RatAB toxin-antitoxin module
VRVEIVYAMPGETLSEQLDLAAHATVADAIAACAILRNHPQIDFNVNKIGIYGKIVSPTAELKDNDRVEIYRPLLAKKNKTK